MLKLVLQHICDMKSSSFCPLHVWNTNLVRTTHAYIGVKNRKSNYRSDIHVTFELYGYFRYFLIIYYKLKQHLLTTVLLSGFQRSPGALKSTEWGSTMATEGLKLVTSLIRHNKNRCYIYIIQVGVTIPMCTGVRLACSFPHKWKSSISMA